MIPEKFKKYPFVVWGFALGSVGFFAWVFGPEVIWTDAIKPTVNALLALIGAEKVG